MITEPEVNFRKRRLRAVGESLLGDDLGWLDGRRATAVTPPDELLKFRPQPPFR